MRAKIVAVEMVDAEVYVTFLFSTPQPAGSGVIIDMTQTDPRRQCVGTELCFDEKFLNYYRANIGRRVELRLGADGLTTVRLIGGGKNITASPS